MLSSVLWGDEKVSGVYLLLFVLNVLIFSWGGLGGGGGKKVLVKDKDRRCCRHTGKEIGVKGGWAVTRRVYIYIDTYCRLLKLVRWQNQIWKMMQIAHLGCEYLEHGKWSFIGEIGWPVDCLASNLSALNVMVFCLPVVNINEWKWLTPPDCSIQRRMSQAHQSMEIPATSQALCMKLNMKWKSQAAVNQCAISIRNM